MTSILELLRFKRREVLSGPSIWERSCQKMDEIHGDELVDLALATKLEEGTKNVRLIENRTDDGSGMKFKGIVWGEREVVEHGKPVHCIRGIRVCTKGEDVFIQYTGRATWVYLHANVYFQRAYSGYLERRHDLLKSELGREVEIPSVDQLRFKLVQAATVGHLVCGLIRDVDSERQEAIEQFNRAMSNW